MAARIWQKDLRYHAEKGSGDRKKSKKSGKDASEGEGQKDNLKIADQRDRRPENENPGTEDQTPNEYLPIYIISLIEHKSEVDPNVPMQIFSYMACIWKNWEKEMEAKNYDIKSSSFRYPLILPIVYYEGTGKWTAETNLRSRVYDGKSLMEYVPDFRYHVVRIHDYSSAYLLGKKNEMSLIMALNKVQDGNFSEFANLDAEEADEILRDTPEEVLDIVVGTARSLLHKLNVPEDEAEGYLGKLKEEREMGYFFENMKKVDIQEERRKTEEQKEEVKKQKEEVKRQKEEVKKQKEKVKQQKEETDNQRKRAENAEQRADMAEKEMETLRAKIKELENAKR